MAERHPIPLFVMIAHTTLGCAHYGRGHLVAAREHFVRARAAWEPGFPHLQLDQKVLFLGIGALALQQLGESAAAEGSSRELVTYAEPLDDALNASHAYKLAAEYRCIEGDFPGAVAWAERSLAIAEEHGFLHRAALAATLLEQGQTAEARGELTRVSAFVGASGEERHLAELHRAAAACDRAEGRLEAAEAELRRALAVSRAQQSRLFELRALADLADLLVERGRGAEARTLLEPACTGLVGNGPSRELARVRALRARLG